MSILFYRRPDYLAKSDGPITSSECMRYIERAKNSERAIPQGLSFDEIVQHRSLPVGGSWLTRLSMLLTSCQPCTLSDFMDYLVYIEHNAENLQFYLWIQDYTKRWNEQVPEKERALSPEWKVEEKEIPKLAKDEPSENLGKKGTRNSRTVIQMLTTGYGKNDKSFMFEGDEQAINRPDTASFVTSSVTDSMTNRDLSEAAGMKWQPCKVLHLRYIEVYLLFFSQRTAMSWRDQPCNPSLLGIRCPSWAQSFSQRSCCDSSRTPAHYASISTCSCP